MALNPLVQQLLSVANDQTDAPTGQRQQDPSQQFFQFLNQQKQQSVNAFGNVADKLKSAGIGGGSPLSKLGGDRGANQQIVFNLAKMYGWGGMLNALDQLVTHESGWNNVAQNPTSTAYGLFQFLDSTWKGVGGSKTSDPTLQGRYGLDYIKNRYGDPAKAWSFWQKNHWY